VIAEDELHVARQISWLQTRQNLSCSRCSGRETIDSMLGPFRIFSVWLKCSIHLPVIRQEVAEHKMSPGCCGKW